MKKWWLSKTLWVNFLMFLSVVVLEITGQNILDPEAQAGILVSVNAFLRLITKEELTT